MELEDNIHLETTGLLQKGKEFASREYYKKSITLYFEALALIPEPQIDYEVNTWIHIAIGDSYFNLKDFENALIHYKNAYNSEEGVDDAYLWFALGRTHYYLENTEEAKKCFLQSFKLENNEYFSNQDSRYFALIKDNVGIVVNQELPTTNAIPKEEQEKLPNNQKDNKPSRIYKGKEYQDEERKNRPPGSTWSLLDDDE